MRSTLLLCGLVAGLLATPALSAELTRLYADDRAEGTLAEADAEVGFHFHALAGSELRLSVKATDHTDLEPEILLYDPDDVRVDLVGYLKHSEGSSKSKLRKFAMPATGRYTIVLRGFSGTTGSYLLKLKAEHTLKFKDQGRIHFGFDTSLPRFSALEGAALTFKVKGRNGFRPVVNTLLQPDTAEVNISGVTAEDQTVLGSTYFCGETGEYRLRIGAAIGVPGDWKCKIKLTDPSPAKTTHSVDGQPAGTFTAGMKEPGSTPSLPLRSIVQSSDFRVTLSILNPTADLTWTSGESISLMVSLQNVNASTPSVTVPFTRDPWNDIVVRRTDSSDIVWRMNPLTLPFAKQVTFPQLDTRSWSTIWTATQQSGGSLSPGDYYIIATFATGHAGLAQEALLTIRIE
jgi:hypothetical protein